MDSVMQTSHIMHYHSFKTTMTRSKNPTMATNLN